MRRILVIKHGALGDFVLATGPFTAIRAHHLGNNVTLLTTPPFVDLARQSRLFDQVWVDTRPKIWNVSRMWELLHRLREHDIARVYDLQTSKRSSFYFRLMRRPKPEWSGIARGASHPQVGAERVHMHTVDRQAEQLRLAGISHVPHPDLSWVKADLTHLDLPRPFALLAPGGSAHRVEKRWPASYFADLTRQLIAAGLGVVAVGGPSDAAATHAVAQAGGIDLCGHTTLAELVELARRAQVAIGNDTGPMHLAATAGCRSIVLFSKASDPALCAPRGPVVRVLRRPILAHLPVEEVLEAALKARNP
ncbi:MAG: glycosyltransferase family 9 protein [Alphaproteobacteria bacterium]|nr:glycosyltransferase family 9 protein [Alphaproteobacteria bacterium]